MKPVRGASGRFSAAPSISRRSGEIAISFGPKQDTGIHPARNGGWIRRHWWKSPPRNRPPATRVIRGKKSLLPGWMYVPVHQSRSCLRNASPSRRRNGRRATRTGLAAVCEPWAGSGIANASASVSNGAGGGLPNEPFRVVLRLVPGLFYVKCLQRRMFYVFHAFSRASVYMRTTPNISPTPAYRPWNTQNTWNKECFQYREAFHVF